MAKIINTDGNVDIVSPKNSKYFSLEEITYMIGGIVELCFFNDVWFFYNKHGHLLNMPANGNASKLISYPISGICIVIESKELSTPFFSSESEFDVEKQIIDDEYTLYTKTYDCIFKFSENEIMKCKKINLPNNISLDLNQKEHVNKFLVVLNSLLNFYTTKEEYEKCHKINNIYNFYKRKFDGA